jgi:hypothetical protein
LLQHVKFAPESAGGDVPRPGLRPIPVAADDEARRKWLQGEDHSAGGIVRAGA